MLDLQRATDWRIDRTRSTVGFRVRHFGVATVRGTFASCSARLECRDGELHVDGQVDVASVATGDEIRDGRLRDEFFHVAEHPSIALRAHGAERLIGDLTIHGVTRRVVLSAEIEPLGDALHVHARGTLRRSDFGLEWDALRQAGRLLVADEVKVVADVVFTPV
ncbi:MAG TPA: YceI family protein [Solirubrobacter sp.]|nr:YceI family protein [Solirubrobacter sp.]